MKGKEIFTASLAARIRDASIGKPYQPSNGTEGCLFQGHYCYQCSEDNLDEKGEGGCDIILATMVLDRKHEDYPKEWIYDQDGQPTCTAFRRRI